MMICINYGKSKKLLFLQQKKCNIELFFMCRYVLYKESNMLNTEKRFAVNQGVVFPQHERRSKVRDGMKAIKHVMGERKRERIAQHALRIIEQKEAKNKEAELKNDNVDK